MEDNTSEEVLIAQPVDPSRFFFSRIEIYKSQHLGRGSYGYVCKARCDKLPCAAKLLHNVFFTNQVDKSTNEVIKKFNEECRILGAVVHPCVVQFLGVAVLGRENQPVLLTELMEESLYSFITRCKDSQLDLGLHYEVDIAHDVALGLSYLHSRKIIHRDLSSNNVLLAKGGHRAKITDFGVSKFFDEDGSLCSLHGGADQTKCPGTIQFMPPEVVRNRAVYSTTLDVFSFGVICIHLLSKHPPHPGPAEKEEIDPLGRKIYVPIPEIQRRQNEILEISPDHPLLPVAICMIANEPLERPTSDYVCDRIMEIKSAKAYLDSVNKPSNEEKLLRELKQCQTEMKIFQYQEEMQSLSNPFDTTKSLDEALVKELREENVKLKKELDELRAMNSASSNIKSQNRVESNKDDSLTEFHAQSSVNSTDSTASTKSSFSLGQQTWSDLEVPIPCPFTRGSAASLGDKAYFSRPFSALVHELDINQRTWSVLEPCITEEFSLTVFNGHLVAVGGLTGSVCSNTVRRYNISLKVWQNDVYPNLYYPRASPAVASNEKFMIVAGGSSGRPPCNPINGVEMYSKEQKKWYCAYSLPTALSSPVAIIKDDDFFVIGGMSSEGPSWQMYHASLSFLFQRSSQFMVPVAMRQPWQQVQLPVASPAAVLVKERLYLFGGMMGSDDGYEEYSNHVLKYKEKGKKFGISMMPCFRGNCLAVVVSDSSVAVLGGCGSNTAIDIASIS